MKFIRWRLVAAVALGTFIGIYLPSCGQDNRLASQGPRVIAFYQDEPVCAGRHIGYVLVRESPTITAQYRVWICGLDVRQ